MSQPAAILNGIIRERRSVKTALFRPGAVIPDDVITTALENASWAPNHGKTEPWHFVVFTGKGIEKLCDFQAELYKQESGEKFMEAKYQKLKEDYLLASHVVAICLKRQFSKIPVLEETEAVACAVQNFALTLHAYGYGGYWTTGGVTYYEAAKSFFGLNESDMLLGFLLCGVPVSQPQPSPRKPVEAFTTWVSE